MHTSAPVQLQTSPWLCGEGFILMMEGVYMCMCFWLESVQGVHCL